MWNISEIDIPYCIFFFESQGEKSLLYSFNICFYELQLQLAHFHTSRFFWKQKRRKRKKKNSSRFSYVQLFATPWTVARQAPLSIGLPRQEYWSGLPFPSPGNPPNPGIEPGSPVTAASAGEFFTLLRQQGSPRGKCKRGEGSCWGTWKPLPGRSYLYLRHTHSIKPHGRNEWMWVAGFHLFPGCLRIL